MKGQSMKQTNKMQKMEKKAATWHGHFIPRARKAKVQCSHYNLSRLDSWVTNAYLRPFNWDYAWIVDNTPWMWVRKGIGQRTTNQIYLCHIEFCPPEEYL